MSEEEDIDITRDEETPDVDGVVTKLREEIAVYKKERKEYLDGWKRAKADALNEKKRQGQLLAAERDLAVSRVVLAMMPVLDSIRLARSQLSDDARSGIEQVYAQCLRSFEDIGVSVLDPVGEAFDPNRHQSIGNRPVSSEKDDNVVAEVAQVGALLGDRVIRAAMVYVGALGSSDDSEEKHE